MTQLARQSEGVTGDISLTFQRQMAMKKVSNDRSSLSDGKVSSTGAPAFKQTRTRGNQIPNCHVNATRRAVHLSKQEEAKRVKATMNGKLEKGGITQDTRGAMEGESYPSIG